MVSHGKTESQSDWNCYDKESVQKTSHALQSVGGACETEASFPIVKLLLAEFFLITNII